MLRGESHVLEITALPSNRKRSRITVEGGIIFMELPAEEVEGIRPLYAESLSEALAIAFEIGARDEKEEEE